MESYPKEPTKYQRSTPRCVNLDWLEVHAREPVGEPRDANYYRGIGLLVHEREYGTRVYREMFTIYGTDGQPLLEVRRNPASQGLYGIHDPEECHIRLVNRICYFDNAADSLSQFLEQHGYTDIRISRVDICLDFVLFDKGDNPAAFVRRYFRHKYAKINQGRISSHGEDTWTGQEWNSLSWGSKSSPVSTKLYNKTMELYDAKEDTYSKPWIRQAWWLCGMVDDWQRVTKNNVPVNVWRLEFSLRSAVKNWVKIDINGDPKQPQSLRNTLDVYSNRSKMLVMFASLAQHYFHFKKYKQGVRKDRCEDKILFDFSTVQVTYKIDRPDYAAGNSQNLIAKYSRMIAKIRLFEQTHLASDIQKACELLIAEMQKDNMRRDLANPWSKEELELMRSLLAYRTRHPEVSYEIAMQEVKKSLAITDRTIDIF